MPRVIGVLTGGSIGWIFGLVLGWSFFDPETNIWFVCSILGAIFGLYVGFSALFEHWFSPIGMSSIGLVIGWLVSMWLFGDHLGGVGTVITGCVAVIGWKIGSNELFRESNTARGALVGMIHFGFGFCVLFMVLWKLHIRTDFPNVILMSMGYLIFCILGGTIGAWIVHKNRLVN